MTSQLKIYFSLFIVCLTVQISQGCDCIMTPIAWHVSSSYDIVIGEALERTDSLTETEQMRLNNGLSVDRTASRNVVFRIDSALKGNIVDKTMRIYGSTNCDMKFKVGTKYILFLDQSLKVMRCSYSEIFDHDSVTYSNVKRYLAMDEQQLKAQVVNEKKAFNEWHKKRSKKRKRKRA